MKTFLDCMICFAKTSVEATRRLSSDPIVQERVVQEAMRECVKHDFSVPPPVVSGKIHEMIRRILKNPDPYLQAKDQFTKLALRLEPKLRKRLSESDDPFGLAVRLAIAGNVIDFGIHHDLQEDEVEVDIERAMTTRIEPEVIGKFKEETRRATSILYLADNAGEIVFDKLLIELLGPEKVTVAVKEGPIINDATLVEAKASGLTDMVRVITNGSEIPGTILEQAPKEFIRRFRSADVVISKGQGNFEMLDQTDRPIWFLLKIKCQVISQYLNVPVGEFLLHKNRD